MRQHAPTIWMLAAITLLALMVSPLFGTPTRAAPAANITGTVTEPPTPGSATETPVVVPPLPGTPGAPLPGTPTDTAVVVPPLPGTPGAPGNPGTPVPATPVPDQGRGDDNSGGGSGPRETPDVAVFKQADDDSVKPGDSFSYTISVINRGTGGANSVVVSDTMPEGTEILEVSATRGDVSQNGRSVTVTIGDLGPGETVTIVIRARVLEVVPSSELRNNAYVESGPEGSRTRVETSVRIAVEQTPTVTATPVPRSAPLPRQPQGNSRLPRTGTLFADVSDAALLVVLLAAALFCLSMAARSYLGRRHPR